MSAICGAMSTALSRMVANLAAGKQGYEAAQAELAAIEARGKALQQRFLELAKEDEKAYDAVVAAMRLPKANDVERATRKDAMQAAYKRATEVPDRSIGGGTGKPERDHGRRGRHAARSGGDARGGPECANQFGGDCGRGLARCGG